MKVTHKINRLRVGIQRLFTPRSLERACGAVLAHFHIQRSSRAVVSVTDSPYVAPINSYFLTCVGR